FSKRETLRVRNHFNAKKSKEIILVVKKNLRGKVVLEDNDKVFTLPSKQLLC
ncbi:unnamed protein product, partial [Brassica rapa subsp. narinosa]